MAIRPIDLPAAAGIDYSGGDVRHFSQGDAVDVPGMTNPTRNLAERDNLLGEKVNELVAVVNNQEQFVPLPMIRTNVPPGEEIVVTNYRIPPGFEARVLNSVISATPTSTSAEVNIYYAASYGGSTGTAVVTTTPGSEFTGDVNFYQEGEFIVTLKNTGAATLELAASVMLTMRPLGAEGTLLVGSVIQGQQGQPGQRGGIGPQGIPGTGGAGSPGMVWQGAWVNGVSYAPNDVVSYAYSGTYGSWICRIANVASAGVNDPQTSTTVWNYVAFGVAVPGSIGPTGNTGGEAQFTSFIPIGYIVTASNYGTRPYTGEYTAGVVSQPNTAYPINALEKGVYNSTGTVGMALLTAAYRTCFSGSISIILPRIATGGVVDYTTTDISLIAIAAGSVVTYGTANNSSVGAVNAGGTYAKSYKQTTYTNGWGIEVISPDALPMSFVIHGVVSVP